MSQFVSFVLRSLIVVAFLSAQAGLVQARSDIPAQVTPPLWIVEKDGKTLYLFGSIHLLPPELKWDRPELQKARSASQVFVFEAPVNDNAGNAKMTEFVQKSGMLPAGQTLDKVLPPALFKDMEKASWSVQYPPKLLLAYRPWFAAVNLELFGYIKAGFSTYYGVDHVVEEEAKERKAELAYLETVDDQLSHFANLDRKTEIAYLRATVRGILEQPEMPYEFLYAWGSDKTDAMANEVEKGFAEVPALRAQLLVARNRNWVPQLVQMLGSGKTHFVTVGAGHLVGKDSVVAMLRAKGFKVTGP